jgi:hypothetical protein
VELHVITAGAGVVAASSRVPMMPPQHAGTTWLSLLEREGKTERNAVNLHKVALEEFFQLPLGCRIGEVADVQAATLRGTSVDGVLVLVLAGERGIAQSVGNVVDGSVSNFLHGASHFDWMGVDVGIGVDLDVRMFGHGFKIEL